MRPSSSKRADPKVVFRHRDVMEAAVHALVDAGVKPRHIRVDRAVTQDGHVEAAPEHGRSLLVGLAIGGLVGGALAVLWMLGLRAADLVGVPVSWIVLRAVGGIASGAVLGALLALVIHGLARSPRATAGTPSGGFLVTVKTRNEDAAAVVRDLLMNRGGAPAPA